VTHPFHQLYGRDFEFVAHRQNWGEDRVHLHDENGQLFSLPAGWTDVAASRKKSPRGKHPATTPPHHSEPGLLRFGHLPGDLLGHCEHARGILR
jgi:Family of unknown function (DUF5372)